MSKHLSCSNRKLHRRRRLFENPVKRYRTPKTIPPLSGLFSVCVGMCLPLCVVKQYPLQGECRVPYEAVPSCSCSPFVCLVVLPKALESDTRSLKSRGRILAMASTILLIRLFLLLVGVREFHPWRKTGKSNTSRVNTISKCNGLVNCFQQTNTNQGLSNFACD